jgi:uncharacterized protein
MWLLCLLQAGADLTAIDYDGHTALMAAVQVGSLALVQLLLDHGADINAIDNDGQIALFTAALEGHVFMLEMLTQHGLDVISVNNNGMTLLMAATAGEHKAAAEWLIQHGVDVNKVNIHGETALHIAVIECNNDDTTMIELLIAHGANVHIRSDKGETAYDIAIDYGDVVCSRVLLVAGSDVGPLGLHIAIMRECDALVLLLLEQQLENATAVMNAVVPSVCHKGDHCCDSVTALMLCTEAGTVKVLLAAGADAHVTNAGGDTCLYVTARHKLSAAVLCLLIKAGAELHAVNNEGETAAQIAHDRGYTLI